MALTAQMKNGAHIRGNWARQNDKPVVELNRVVVRMVLQLLTSCKNRAPLND